MLQVSSTNFTGNSGTNGGAMAMQSTTNATFSGITAVGNSAGCGGGMFVDRAASILVTHHKAIPSNILVKPFLSEIFCPCIMCLHCKPMCAIR